MRTLHAIAIFITLGLIGLGVRLTFTTAVGYLVILLGVFLFVLNVLFGLWVDDKSVERWNAKAEAEKSGNVVETDPFILAALAMADRTGKPVVFELTALHLADDLSKPMTDDVEAAKAIHPAYAKVYDPDNLRFNRDPE